MAVDQWRNSASVIVDMQNDFVRKCASTEVPNARQTIWLQRETVDEKGGAGGTKAPQGLGPLIATGVKKTIGFFRRK